MAKPEAPAAANAAPAEPVFVARPMTVLPKRETPKSEPDLKTANALLAIVTGTTEIDGTQVANTASDGKTYATQEAARKVANSAKRKLEHVAPDGKSVKSRVYGEGQSWEWAVYLADAKPPKNGTEAAATAETPTEGTPAAS